MKQYLTISEFSELRNVNINSLRYYEKLGLLNPARVDPNTKYRYYLPEQLVTLDIITLCIRLGIPLKQLENYLDGTGGIDQAKFLKDGKALLQKRVEEIQLGLEFVQFNLDAMAENQAHSTKRGFYTRTFPERFFVARKFCGDWNSVTQKETFSMELFREAQARALAPVFPAGVLVHCENDANTYSVFFQVLHPSSQQDVLHIPAGQYTCLQVDLTPETDLPAVLETAGLHGQAKTVIVSNMLLDKLHFSSRQSEIQIPESRLK